MQLPPGSIATLEPGWRGKAEQEVRQEFDCQTRLSRCRQPLSTETPELFFR